MNKSIVIFINKAFIEIYIKMALLKKIHGPGVNGLETIIRLNENQAKSISASDLEIGTAMSINPEDLIMSYAGLSHAAVQKAEKKEIREKAETIIDITKEFLVSKHLEQSLYHVSDLSETEQRAAKKKSKQHAEELLKQIFSKVVNFYPNNENLINAAQTTFNFRNQDFEGILYEKTGLVWEQLIEQLTQLNNLNRNNQEFQRFVGFIAQRVSTYGMQKKALSEEFGPEQEWNPLLENEVKGFANSAGYELGTQSYNNGQLWSLLDAIVEHNTYDLKFDFERDIEKLDPSNSLDNFIQNIDINDSANKYLSKENINSMSKQELVDLYAKLSHSKVSQKVMEQTSSTRKEYQNIIKEILGNKDKVETREEAEEIVNKLLQAYIKKRWGVTGGSEKVDAALKLYNEDKTYANVLLSKDIVGRRFKKRELIKQIMDSKDLLADRDISKTLDAFASASVKSQITKKNIYEAIHEDAIGYHEPKDKEIVEAGQKYANAMGYGIKENSEVGTVLNIIERTMYQKTYDLSDDFSRLDKKPIIH